MKCILDDDFLYIADPAGAKIVLKSCDKNCPFCPAANLTNFINHQKLKSEYDYSQDKLSIYGDASSPYLLSFLRKVLEENPDTKIYVEGCRCCIQPDIVTDYSHLIHPMVSTVFDIMPDRFIIPATGEIELLKAFRLRYTSRYPNIPVIAKVLDAGSCDVTFWTDTKVTEFNS